MSDDIADLGALADSLRQVFPELAAVTPLRLLGNGFRSMAVETAGGIVFRIGKNADAVAGHAREARLLPVLALTLPVAIPAPRWHVGPCAALPFGAIGYPKLPGIVPQPGMLTSAGATRLADDVVRFLLCLHRVSVGEAARLGLPHPATRPGTHKAMRDDVLPALHARLATDEYAAISRWWDAFLGDESLFEYAPALIHGDQWYENLLVDEDTHALVGVLDWEDAAIGDPAQDLATQRHMGAAFAGEVLHGYRAGGLGLEPSFDHRVQSWWELRELDGVAFAARANDTAELEDAIRKLRAGPILRGA